MEKLSFGLDDSSATGDQKQSHTDESQLLGIQRCIKYLVHTCQCRDATCRLPSCQKMKRVVQHAKSCKQKTNGGCPICKQLIALCCYHAKHCQETKCPVPFCVNIKNKLRQQKLQERLQQAEILKRRIATMQNRGMSRAVLQPPVDSNSSSQPSPGAQPHTSPHPPQPHKNSITGSPQVISNLGTSIADMQQPTQDWQQFLQALKSPASAQQQQQIVAILKTNPQLMDALMKEKTAQQQEQQHMLLNEGNKIGMQQFSQIIRPNSVPSSTGNSTMAPSQVMSNLSPSIAGMSLHTEAWQQLLQTLKSPASTQQQQQVLAILNANPQVMAACIGIMKANPQIMDALKQETVHQP